jgi:hypothetical protein
MSQVVPRIKADILAIDTALAMHKIKFNTDLISPVKVQEVTRLLSYGAVIRSIYEWLKITGRPTTPTEVTNYIISRYQLEIPEDGFIDFRERVSNRMGQLTWHGKLTRLHLARTTLEGKWILPKED